MTTFHESGRQRYARLYRLKLEGAIRGRASGVFRDEPSLGEVPSFFRDAPRHGFKARPRYKYVDHAAYTGVGVCHLQIANLYLAQIRFHCSNGHGFAAEQGNHLIDRIRLRDSSMLGDDNAKYGPDRLVEGMHVQSKYCATGKGCIDNCFTRSNTFKYLNKDGSVMQIEVPADKYAEAVAAMQERIRNGQVPGAADPEKASEIVRKGSLTYKQAVNIAKFGNIESITFDTVNGIKIGLISGSLSAAVAFAFAIRTGEPMAKALRRAAWVGFKVGGLTMAISVISSQVGRTAFEQAFRNVSKNITRKLSSKAASAIVKAMTGKVLHGNVARVTLARLLRGNIASIVVTSVVMSVPDIIKTIRGRVSGVQLTKNISQVVCGVAGGYGGAIAGATVGTLILPVYGTYVGGVLGSALGGYAGTSVTGALLDNLIIDDAVAMLVIFEQELVSVVLDYGLINEEADSILKGIVSEGLPKLLETLYAQNAAHRSKHAYDLIEKQAQTELKKRKPVALPGTLELALEAAEMVGELAAEHEAGNLQSSEGDEPYVPEVPFAVVFKEAFSKQELYIDESFLWGDRLKTDKGRKKLGNALQNYGRTHGGVSIHTVLAVVDTTAFGSASEGAIFTEDAVWIRCMISGTFKLEYTDFTSYVEVHKGFLWLAKGKNVGLPAATLALNVTHMISIIKNHYRR